MLAGFMLIFIVLFNLITIFLLRFSKNDYYIKDTVLFIISILFASAASMTGWVSLYVGVFIYAGYSIKSNNIFKIIVLFSGFIIGYYMNNNFYVYSSILFIFLYSSVRFVESFIDLFRMARQNEINKTGTSD